MTETGEQANLKILGQTLELMWRSSPIKVFLMFLSIVFISCITFSFRVNPIYPFVLMVGILLIFGIYMLILLPQRPELFQDSKTWLGYQKMMLGDKQSGLREIPANLELFQPITVTKSVTAKANIKSTEVLQK